MQASRAGDVREIGRRDGGRREGWAGGKGYRRAGQGMRGRYGSEREGRVG